jgi:hypothetical protein
VNWETGFNVFCFTFDFSRLIKIIGVPYKNFVKRKVFQNNNKTLLQKAVYNQDPRVLVITSYVEISVLAWIVPIENPGV